MKYVKMQEKILDKGAKLITQEEYLVHTTGHASRQDLENMYNLLNPKIVLPVHGDKKFIREHKRFAKSCGIKNVFSAKNGDICIYKKGKISLLEQIPTDIMGVDRGRSVSLNSELVKNRRRIMYNCTLFISAVVKNNKLNSLQLSSIDILEENEWYVLEQDILSEVIPLIEKKLLEKPKRTSLEDFIRGQIRRRVLIKTDIKPVTTLHLHIEDDEQ